MNAATTHAWIDANQRLLVAEFARLKQLLGEQGDAEAMRAELASARAAMPGEAAIDALAQGFGLSPFERDVLLLCAGIEMDAGLARQCEIAQGDPRKHFATFGLALAALESPHWSALAPVGPLRRWRLVELDDAAGIASGRLRIDERILHYLAGVNYLDARLRGLLRPVATPSVMATTHRAAADALREAIPTASGDAPHVWLTGDDPPGQADVAAHVASTLGLALQMLRVEDIASGHGEWEALATLWDREAMLLDCALLVECGAEPLPTVAARFIDAVRGLVFASASQPQTLERPCLHATIDKPGPIEQRLLWQTTLGAAAEKLNGSLDGVASQFRLSARTIHDNAPHIVAALAQSPQPDSAMWSACRGMGRSKLDALAQHIETNARWDDLILPDAQTRTLRQIAAHVRNRLKVHLDWGFAERNARGLGINALFSGESGTGKTLAAEVLARELQLDLYRIDLSAVVNKYIGETEKNLRRVFDAAEGSGAILLFDEADALFGKRSEVKDSHDRYANIEVSYLLQRMETYRGLAILTSNLKGALDVAFQRRLRFVVHFAFPDQAQREAIWRRAFPERTPREAVDYAKLARLAVTGGSIRNIAINAAFQAAEMQAPVSMAHLLQAAHHEAGKRERPLSDAQTRGWV